MDYAIVFDRMGLKGARNAATYELAQATWLDATPIPTQAACSAEWGRYLAEQSASATVEQQHQSRMAAIRQKRVNGQTLTTQEVGYLADHVLRHH